MANGTIGVSQIDVLTTSGTGTLSIVPPATNTNRTLTLPDGTGTIVANGVNGSLVSGTAVASTSGTSIDFTGIPSWVKRITVMFNGVSTSGTSNWLIQLGDSGGVENTGYVSGSTATTTASGISTSTAGFILRFAGAAQLGNGSAIFNLLSGNVWVGQGTFYDASGTQGVVTLSGSKELSATLDRIRITTVNGTDTFDAGTVNILYE